MRGPNISGSLQYHSTSSGRCFQRSEIPGHGFALDKPIGIIAVAIVNNRTEVSHQHVHIVVNRLYTVSPREVEMF